MVAIAAAVALLAAWPQTAPAEEDPFPPVKVVLHPAAEPKPALKYRLLPDVLDRKPGNAAVVYGKVKADGDLFSDSKEYKEFWEKVEHYGDAARGSLADLRKEKGQWRQELTWPLGPFRYLDQAARCRYCDWQYPIGEPGQIPWAIQMPEVQQMRGFARLVRARARVQIADGKYDDALYTLQTGYALSQHAAAGPFLVNYLVGVACEGLMSDQVLEFIQQPGAPNLYWALTDLPRPLVDLRPAMEVEMTAVYLYCPDLRDLEHKVPPPGSEWPVKHPGRPELDSPSKGLTPQQWQDLMEKTINRLYPLAMFDEGAIFSEKLPRLYVTGQTLRLYPEAKRFLVARGHTAAEVEAMPVPQVVLLYTMGLYDELRDDAYKWLSLPCAEAGPGLAAADKALKAVYARKAEIIPVATALVLPVIQAINVCRGREERSFAMLRVLEALRIYGADHDRLPDKLADVTEVPIPVDPWSAKPFIYRRTGDAAWLEAPVPARLNPQFCGPCRYDIRFVPKGK